jgi:thioredoxin 1
MKANFDSVINDERPVIVDFHAIWCSPCKMQSPILKEVAGEYGEKVRIIKIDVDHNPEISSRYNVQSVPTLMIFKNGKLVWRQSGVASKAQLNNILSQNI